MQKEKRIITSLGVFSVLVLILIFIVKYLPYYVAAVSNVVILVLMLVGGIFLILITFLLIKWIRGAPSKSKQDKNH